MQDQDLANQEARKTKELNVVRNLSKRKTRLLTV